MSRPRVTYTAVDLHMRQQLGRLQRGRGPAGLRASGDLHTAVLMVVDICIVTGDIPSMC